MSQEFYKQRLAVEAGELIWFAEDRDEPYVQWCLDLGIKVFVIGNGFLTDTGYVVGSSGGYGNTIGDSSEVVKSGVYCCAPDLKDSFNTGCTYYLDYGNNLNSSPKIGDPIYKDVPSDWYDYGNKKWANIATSSKGRVSYYTWIPRYMVKLDNEGHVVTTGSGAIDLVFVNLNNEYISATETKSESVLKGEGYVLPDAFSFNGQQLSGIWVGKYEISDPQEATGFLSTSTEKSITVNSITVKGQSPAEPGTSGDFKSRDDITVSIEGTSNTKTGKLPITFDDLMADKEYSIKVVIPDVMGDIVLTKKVRTTEGSVHDVAAPDLSGFEPNNTYYYTYSDVSKEGVIGQKIQTVEDNLFSDRKIASNPPSDWYDYDKKKWANIVTMNADGEAAFYTWVPRYEYKIDEELKSIDIVYITGNRTEADDGYIIPDAFKFNGKQLSGIWVGKYEITDVAIPIGFNTTSIDNGFKVTGIMYDTTCTKSNMPSSGTMVIKKDGSTVKTETVSVNGTVTGLQPGTYTVEWTLELGYEKADGKGKNYKTLTQQIAVRGSVSPEKPDLSGFYKDYSTSYVYYVDYGANLNDLNTMTVGDRVAFNSDGSASNMPQTWYDYSAKKWANILVSNTQLVKGTKVNSLSSVKDLTMWVWIPRYEYKVEGSVSSVFIGKNDSADSGYQIPDAFKFNNNNLAGIWVGKYEIADQLKD